MTIGEVLRRSAQHLEAKGSTTPRLDAELLLARALGLARIDLYMQIDRPLTHGRARRGAAARRTPRSPRAAAVRARRMGVQAPDTDGRRACSDPAARDGDAGRAGPRAPRRLRLPARARRRHRHGGGGARHRGRARGSPRDGRGRLGGRARARRRERRAHGPRGRASASRPLPGAAGRALGARRLEPAVRRRRRPSTRSSPRCATGSRTSRLPRQGRSTRSCGRRPPCCPSEAGWCSRWATARPRGWPRPWSSSATDRFGSPPTWRAAHAWWKGRCERHRRTRGCGTARGRARRRADRHRLRRCRHPLPGGAGTAAVPPQGPRRDPAHGARRRQRRLAVRVRARVARPRRHDRAGAAARPLHARAAEPVHVGSAG